MVTDFVLHLLLQSTFQCTQAVLFTYVNGLILTFLIVDKIVYTNSNNSNKFIY